MNLRYRITLTPEERDQLRSFVQAGKGAFRRLKRAQILLASEAGSSDATIAQNISVGTSTVYRTKRRFVEEGLEAALSELARPGADRKLAEKEEALLIATACSTPPIGRARRTLELLAGERVRLTKHDSISSDTIRRRLAENELKPRLKKMWCISAVNPEFIARMEDALDLYAEKPDALHPVVCFDETPRQLIGESRVPVPPKPGRPARFDYECVRNGTANVFMFVDAHRSWRHAKVTDRRACGDFAQCMRDLVDTHYPTAERIRVVPDNLSTHSTSALYGDLRAGRGPPHPPSARVSLHAEARQLAEHGGARDRRHGGPMPRPPYPDEGDAHPRSQSLGECTEQHRSPDQVAIHARARAREARQGVPVRPPQASDPRRSVITVTTTAPRY